MIQDQFLRRCSIGVGIFVVFGGFAWMMSRSVKYKPWGVSDYQRPVYEAKLKHLKDLQEASERAAKEGVKPVLYCTEKEHDFGLINPHTTVSHTFRLENRGKAPLQLTAADTSCKCTLSDVGDEWVAPGKHTDVTLTYNSGNVAELYRQYALVRTNDPEQPEVELVVIGKIKAKLAVDQQEIVFPDVYANKRQSGSVSVYSQYWPAFELSKIECDLPGATWQVEPLPSEDLKKLEGLSGWRILFAVTPENDRRYFGGVLRISVTPEEPVTFTDPGSASEVATGEEAREPAPDAVEGDSVADTADATSTVATGTEGEKPPAENERMVEIPVRGSIAKMLTLMGPQVHAEEGIQLGVLEEGKEHTFKLLIRWRGGELIEPLTVKSVRPEFMQVSVEPGARPNLPVLKIVVPADAPATVFDTTVAGQLVLAHPELPGGVFRVPLRGVVSPLEK